MLEFTIIGYTYVRHRNLIIFLNSIFVTISK